MKLVASLIVRNEVGRYLEECVEHLLAFCDELRILDDGSTDGTLHYLRGCGDRVRTISVPESEFFAHEGRARQRLLDWTLGGGPTHVLCIDADEFVTDGQALRAALETEVPPRTRHTNVQNTIRVWTLDMQEVWEADGDCLCIREDGGWHSHPVPVVYSVPPVRPTREWQIADRALACGREPHAVRKAASRAVDTGVDLLHLGWANEAERVARHHRYAVADGGKFHAGTHLDSILWAADRVTLRGRPWPSTLSPWQTRLITRIHRPDVTQAP